MAVGGGDQKNFFGQQIVQICHLQQKKLENGIVDQKLTKFRKNEKKNVFQVATFLRTLNLFFLLVRGTYPLTLL